MDEHPRAVDHRDVVRRASLLAALVVTALFVQAGSAVAATGFSDPFDTLDGGRWSAGDHQLGRSRLDPANVAVAGGRQTHTETRSLEFDPTATFHTYEIDLARKAVTFRVDGVALRTWKNGVPTAPMALYLNSWFPAWLAGTPSPGAATLVDRVDVTP
jgi:beta-glucanase (GH16 family)